MPAIFISYRRSDSEGEAGRLSDLLTTRFSGQSVFMDVDSIKPGRDFRRAIEESIQECSVLLALIGPAWLEAATREGTRRLDAPNDYVRLEIAAALQRDIPVIPILVRGAHMPQPEQLPQDLHELAYRNSVELTHARWKSDLQLLIDALDPLLHKPTLPAPRPVALAPDTYRPPPSPAPLHPYASPPPVVTTRPGPSARRAAYTTPLPRSPFADTPTTIIRPSVRPVAAPAPAPLPRAAISTPPYIPPAQPPVSVPIPPKTQHTAPPGSQVPSLQPAHSSNPEPAQALQGAAVDRVSRELAHFIGPIAEIVVKRAAKRSATLEDLCAIVSHEIESAPDRARFLAKSRT